MGGLAMWLYHRLSSETNNLTQEQHARSRIAGRWISSMQCSYMSLSIGIDVFTPLQTTSFSLVNGTLHLTIHQTSNAMIQSISFPHIRSQSLISRSIDLAALKPPPRAYLPSLTSAYPSLPESLITPINILCQPMSPNVKPNDTVEGG